MRRRGCLATTETSLVAVRRTLTYSDRRSDRSRHSSGYLDHFDQPASIRAPRPHRLVIFQIQAARNRRPTAGACSAPPRLCTFATTSPGPGVAKAEKRAGSARSPSPDTAAGATDPLVAWALRGGPTTGALDQELIRVCANASAEPKHSPRQGTVRRGAVGFNSAMPSDERARKRQASGDVSLWLEPPSSTNEHGTSQLMPTKAPRERDPEAAPEAQPTKQLQL
jgi:hypothetical protein